MGLEFYMMRARLVRRVRSGSPSIQVSRTRGGSIAIVGLNSCSRPSFTGVDLVNQNIHSLLCQDPTPAKYKTLHRLYERGELVWSWPFRWSERRGLFDGQSLITWKDIIIVRGKYCIMQDSGSVKRLGGIGEV